MAAPLGPLPTQVDLELASVPRGAELSAAIAPNRAARGVMASAPTYPGGAIDVQADDLVVTWGDLQQRNPEWSGDFWQECRALYAGGPRLLNSLPLMKRLFPPNMHENPQVYAQRCARAHYFPYAGTILDHLLAGLGTDPLAISFTEVDEAGKVTKPPPEAEWWMQWVTDVTDEAERPADYGLTSKGDEDDDDDEGGCSLHEFLVEVLREALQTRTAWVQMDLPPFDAESAAELAIDSQLAAEQAAAAAGVDDPYLCLVPAEQVIDWVCDDRGRLEWVLVLTVEQPRPTLRTRRGRLLHTYTLWTSEMWVRYEVMVDPAKLPNENEVIRPVEARPHDFGRVPFERLQLPEGLYAMGKLHSLAREHFNKRCAMSWAEYKSLFKVLYEFLGPEDDDKTAVADAQTDASRATNQIRGQGYTQVRGKDDRAEYVGPDPETFTAARESCNDAMREMHRVMFSMALSANMDSKALNRTAESKDKDEATTTVLLDAFGVMLRKFARRLFVLASLGRREAVPHAEISGMQDFDVESTTAVINEAVALYTGVPIKSALFNELYLDRTYATILGDMTPDQRETMREQIREAISQEELMAEAMAMSAMQPPLGDDDEEQPGSGGGPPAAGAPPNPTPGKPGAAPGKQVQRMSGGRSKK